MNFLNINRLNTILIIIILGLLLFNTYYLINNYRIDIPIIEEKTIEKEIKEEPIIETKTTNKYHVDIKGLVKKPGVYEIEEGKIVNDVINMAGGLKTNAYTQNINLSKKIQDEMVIIIYSKSEISNNDKKVNECVCPSEVITKCTDEKETIIITENSKEDNSNNKISINTGTLEEIMTLPGIGESKAKTIIEYREKNNGFKSLEELMNVSGIGEAAYNKIKDYITL